MSSSPSGPLRTDLEGTRDLSAQIADAIRAAIVAGTLRVDERLPSEAELSDSFGVSRPTVREALKRLAAQNLIRTQRGATGGAFVNRMTYEAAREGLVTTSTLLLSMNDVDFDTAVEARFALEAACVPLACARRRDDNLARMRDEITRQQDESLSDEAFCASDVAFHRALVDATGNPVLAYQLAGAVEAMQPLMNMVTFTARSRARISRKHQRIHLGLTNRDVPEVLANLAEIENYTRRIAAELREARAD
ncbi:GntR family transcriptional regulator [uncultured Maritimibacter sp.]|jgi:DNA-binding FadR family transcriptional regulator|uniref:FadR/GntR family transcriptional regulator n=1 Tax=uncultured Maritimibacter sp. TaxID=991866 RepID=UPI000ACD00CC|nr:GntR family transcriptional regulator [uncultured Maritimibacter sp.]